MLGGAIDRLALPHHDHAADDHPHGWARWGRAVAARPWPALLGAVVVLGLLSVPVLDLTLGQQDNGALPTHTNARAAYDGMTAGFGVGANGPLLVGADLSAKPAKADQSKIDKLDSSEKSDKAKANKQADAKQAQAAQGLELQGVPPAQAQQKAAARVKPKRDVQLKQIDDSYAAKRKQVDQPATDPRLQTLRTDLEKTAGVASVSAEVGGTTAGYVDLADEIASRLVLTIAVVVALSFVLLLIAFRSIVIPLTAGLMNLVSIGAAFGVVTAVFEKGWGPGWSASTARSRSSRSSP